MTMSSSGILASLVLICGTAFQDLSSINDLKKIDFGKSVPKHSLLLLHWFANVIDIDQSNTIILTFDPDTEKFGSHHYGNYEDMLEQLPRDQRYFTVGNLYEHSSHELPQYVRHPLDEEYKGTNMDRIIFRVQETNSEVRSINQVYLTQHFRTQDEKGTGYNPKRTYRIALSLLQQMRMFSVQNNHRSLQELRDLFHSNAEESQLQDIRNTWGEKLTCLGLLVFIVIQEKPYKESYSSQTEDEECGDTSTQAQYKATESNDSALSVERCGRQLESIDQNERSHHPEQNGITVPIVRDHTNHNADICELTQTYEDPTMDNCDRSIDPSLDVSGDRLGRQQCEYRSPDIPIHAQPFNRVPESLPGQQRDVVPSVCPRSSQEPPPQCPTREATQRNPEQMPEAPQPAPLDPLNNVLQDDLKPFIFFLAAFLCLLVILLLVIVLLVIVLLVIVLLVIVLLTIASLVSVQFENTARGSDRPGRVVITGYNTHLELVVTQHKACARLYVKEPLSDWKYEMGQSWVGFYKSADKDTYQYEWGKWQWVVKFDSCQTSVDYNGYCYEYCSGMDAAPGVQARFILAKYREIARTPSLYSPEGVKITGYSAHLELFETDGKVCARLYVKKSFTQWTYELGNSWVGFYTAPERGINDYERWQWSTKFKQYESYWEFNVLEYCSDMKATPGAHARFILNNMEKARAYNKHLY